MHNVCKPINRVGQNPIYTVYIPYIWQGNDKIYGHTRCIYRIFGRETTKYTVIYGIYTVYLAGKPPDIRSYTVYIRYTWQGNHQIYGHIRCIYTILVNPTYKCMVLANAVQMEDTLSIQAADIAPHIHYKWCRVAPHIKTMV
jgi:hypothetical protein